MHIAQKFEWFLDTHRRPDGQRWSGADLAKATGGVVPRSYVTNLRKGRIENPGYEKLRAIAKAMGFPPALWFEEGNGARIAPAEGSRGLAGRVEHLFGAIKNPATSEPYSNADVARMSAGDLTEGDVEGIRTGSVSNPPLDHVLALADVFGVQPSYLVDRSKEAVLLDGKLVEALRNETVRAVTRESAQLPEREMQMVLGIVRQFRGPSEASSD